MQIITKREAKAFVRDKGFTFFCCFSAMSDVILRRRRLQLSKNHYIPNYIPNLANEVRDVSATNALVSTASQFHSWLPQEIYEEIINFPLHQNVFTVPVVRLFSQVHFVLWFLSSN